MIIRKTKGFADSYNVLPDDIKKKVKKTLDILLFNLHHPSLRLKKLKGYQDIWYGMVDKNYRFTFRIEGNFIILRSVGAHNSVIKKP